MTFQNGSSESPVPGQDIEAELIDFAKVGLIRRWRPHGPDGSYIAVTGAAEITLHNPGQARAFIAGLRALWHSPQRTEFLELVSAADAMQTEAERLCEEANESGLENDEFAVREAADELRARALGVAEVILGTP